MKMTQKSSLRYARSIGSDCEMGPSASGKIFLVIKKKISKLYLQMGIGFELVGIDYG